MKFNGEFDFESSNARFDKEKIESELKSEIERMKISSQDEEVNLSGFLSGSFVILKHPLLPTSK